MNEWLEIGVGTLLASVRVIAMFQIVPVFSHAGIPIRARTALAFAIVWLVAPEVPAELFAAPSLALAAFVLQEAMIGLLLGFAASLLFAAFDLLGEFISIQGGLGAASVVDPSSGASSVALASTLHTFALLAFVALDGHLELLRAVALSYEHLPVGGGGPDVSAHLAVVRLGGAMFEIGFRLAAPIAVTMMISNLGVGILGRVIPQLNLMMLQLPAQVALSLGLVMLGAGHLMDATRQLAEPWPERVLRAVVGAD